MGYYRDHDWESKWIDLARETLERVFRTYGTSTIQSGHEEPSDEFRRHLNKRPRMNDMEELYSYLALPRATAEADVLGWWKSSSSVFPCLSEMATDYLAIPATGAPAERTFSIGTHTVTPERASLNPDTIRACMWLNAWLKWLHERCTMS